MKQRQELMLRLYDMHVDMVYRIAMMLLKNEANAEDAVQAVFIKLLEKDQVFNNAEHEKAWLIVTTQNYCKNHLKSWWQKGIAYDSNFHDSVHNDVQDNTLEFVMNLPEKFKLPIYLYYYEGYSSDEIAKLLDLNASTLRSRLKKGRELLCIKIGGE